MKIINGILILCMVSFTANAASNETERRQLEEINRNAIAKTERARDSLNEAIKYTITDVPKRKKEILRLAKTWEKFIQQKCKLYTSESRYTDAEIALENRCLYEEYTAEEAFFKKIIY